MIKLKLLPIFATSLASVTAMAAPILTSCNQRVLVKINFYLLDESSGTLSFTTAKVGKGIRWKNVKKPEVTLNDNWTASGWLVDDVDTTLTDSYAIKRNTDFYFLSLYECDISDLEFDNYTQGDTTAKITGYHGENEFIKIPSSFNDGGQNVKITSIGDNAFYNCPLLEKIELGKNLTSIGNSAFNGCISLSYIHYDGLKNNFEMVQKGIDWHKNVYTDRVVCTDQPYFF